MKIKLLLITFLLMCGMLSAQDTINSLIITEARMDLGEKNYLEITNLGDTAINLSIIELGQIRPWGPAPGNEFEPETVHGFN